MLSVRHFLLNLMLKSEKQTLKTPEINFNCMHVMKRLFLFE